MLQTPEHAAQIIEQFDKASPELKRGFCNALVERLINAERILAELGIECRGLPLQITPQGNSPFMPCVHLQLGTEAAWLVTASRAHPYT